ncbi:basic secretory protein-like protein [Carboxylicivirga sp. RSCT41]|uniref:basic secretory protein-like protein n=1 Tax=Carboxylicivirga agarovorans TaxID=3417570 RepID=UPI003D3546CC
MKLFKYAGRLLVCTALLASCSKKIQKEYKLTAYTCSIESKQDNSPVGEDVTKLVDGDVYSKFLTFSRTATITIQPVKRSRLTAYSLVSGNDEPGRDPQTWTLEGSLDGKEWILLDSRSKQVFEERNMTRLFDVAVHEDYAFYRFSFSTDGHDILQLSEIELNGLWDANDERPIAKFTAGNASFFDQGAVQFKNESEQAADYLWYFEGGYPSSSTEDDPLIEYKSHGKYPVKLIASNNGYSDTILINDFVIVKRKGGWDHFQYPQINFVNKTLGGNGDLYKELVPEPIDLIKQVSLDVCHILYRSVDEVDVLEVLDYSIEDIETISAKGGNPPHINIFFSSSYLKKKKGILSDEELIAEIVGVLYHELAHGYQYSPRGAGGYARGADYFGLIEGIADYVRLNAGYSSYDYRKPGGHWNDGYKTTAFFIDWLHTKDKDFAYKLNQSAITIVPWSWDSACQDILSASVKDLWDEYQTYLKNESTN